MENRDRIYRDTIDDYFMAQAIAGDFYPLYEIPASSPAKWLTLDIVGNPYKDDQGRHAIQVPFLLALAANEQLLLSFASRLGITIPMSSPDLLEFISMIFEFTTSKDAISKIREVTSVDMLQQMPGQLLPHNYYTYVTGGRTIEHELVPDTYRFYHSLEPFSVMLMYLSRPDGTSMYSCAYIDVPSTRVCLNIKNFEELFWMMKRIGMVATISLEPGQLLNAVKYFILSIVQYDPVLDRPLWLRIKDRNKLKFFTDLELVENLRPLPADTRLSYINQLMDDDEDSTEKIHFGYSKCDNDIELDLSRDDAIVTIDKQCNLDRDLDDYAVLRELSYEDVQALNRVLRSVPNYIRTNALNGVVDKTGDILYSNPYSDRYTIAVRAIYDNREIEYQEIMDWYLNWLMVLGIWMRGWKGPGYPYPYASGELASESEIKENVKREITKYRYLVDILSDNLPTRDLIYMVSSSIGDDMTNIMSEIINGNLEATPEEKQIAEETMKRVLKYGPYERNTASDSYEYRMYYERIQDPDYQNNRDYKWLINDATQKISKVVLDGKDPLHGYFRLIAQKAGYLDKFMEGFEVTDMYQKHVDMLSEQGWLNVILEEGSYEENIEFLEDLKFLRLVEFDFETKRLNVAVAGDFSIHKVLKLLADGDNITPELGELINMTAVAHMLMRDDQGYTLEVENRYSQNIGQFIRRHYLNGDEFMPSFVTPTERVHKGVIKPLFTIIDSPDAEHLREYIFYNTIGGRVWLLRPSDITV